MMDNGDAKYGTKASAGKIFGGLGCPKGEVEKTDSEMVEI
jgi:hypothetical protein